MRVCVISPLTGLKKLKKESLGTCLVTVRTVPRPLCFCFFLMVFTVTSFPLCQSIWQLERGSIKKWEAAKSKYTRKKAEVGRPAKKRLICGLQNQKIYIENTKNKYCTNHTSISELKLNITCLPQFDKHIFKLWFSPLTVNDLWSFKWERIWGIRLWLHLVDLSENCIVEVTIGLKVEP